MGLVSIGFVAGAGDQPTTKDVLFGATRNVPCILVQSRNGVVVGERRALAPKCRP